MQGGEESGIFVFCCMKDPWVWLPWSTSVPCVAKTEVAGKGWVWDGWVSWQKPKVDLKELHLGCLMEAIFPACFFCSLQMQSNILPEPQCRPHLGTPQSKHQGLCLTVFLDNAMCLYLDLVLGERERESSRQSGSVSAQSIKTIT